MKRNRLLLLLVLLMTAATGAWADETPLLTIESTDYADFRSGSMSFDDKVTIIFSDEVENDGDTDGWYRSGAGSLLTVAGINGYTITSCKFYTKTGTAANGYTIVGESPSVYLSQGFVYTDDSKSVNLGTAGVKKIEVYGAAAASGYSVSLKDGVKDADKWTITPNPAEEGQTVTLQYNGRLKVKGVKATSDAGAPAATYTLLSAATTSDYGKVVCAAGHLHDAKTAVPDGCTAVGILGKVTETGHGLILALKDATSQTWNTINGWTSVTTYAGTTLKVLPDDAARGTNLTSYTKLGETAVSNWAVGQKGDYEAIFENLGSTTGNDKGKTYDDNVNAYITTGVGSTAIDGRYWSATEDGGNYAWYFRDSKWTSDNKGESHNVRPVLGFGGEAAESAKPAATVTTAPTGAAVVGVGKTTALVSGGVAEGGTLMYAVTTTNTMPTSTAGFSDAVPTAKDITASGKVYVWYYVKGDDTHSDSEIAATAIEVPVADIVWDVTNISDLEVMGFFESYAKEGVTLSGNAEDVQARWRDKGNPTKDGIEFIAMESGGFTFTAPTGKKFTKIEMTLTGSAGWDIANLGTGWAINNTTVTWTGSAAASTVDLLKDVNSFNGERVKSIVFYLSE